MSDSDRIAWPAYLVSAAMIFIPLVDAMTSLFPWQFGEARWRFGAVGLVSNALLIPMTGLLVAFATAVLLNHRVFRRVICVVSFLASVVALGALIVFGLDALQTRAAVRPEMRISFTVASWTAGLKTLLASITFLAVGIASLRGPGAVAPARSSDTDVPLILSGQPVKPGRPGT